MIKSTELRIGNYLQSSCIIKIDAKFIYEYDKVGGNYKPIPLSEEILLKAGFEKCLNGLWSETEIFNVKIIDNEILVYLAGSDTNLAHNNLKNLHQLQNLYWCLCGEELTINL